MKDYTFTIIKPTAMKNGHAGAVLKQICNDGGFRIAALRMTKMDEQKAKTFYGIHKDRPFFKDLVNFMTSGPIIVAVLEKENAVVDFRKLIGNTNPKLADKGTIRNLYGVSIQENCVHGSDSNENAKIEMNQFFTEDQIFKKKQSKK